ncbi:MAG: glycosyltransferase family 2 protein, partial [Bacteroidaceae bacterium]
YKNLSQASYKRVMRWRWFLDYVAAFFFLSKFQWRSFSAVYQARKDARLMRIHYNRKDSRIEQDEAIHKPFCVLFKKPKF